MDHGMGGPVDNVEFFPGVKRAPAPVTAPAVRLVPVGQKAGLFRRFMRAGIFIHPCSFLIGMAVGGYVAGVSIWVVLLWL